MLYLSVNKLVTAATDLLLNKFLFINKGNFLYIAVLSDWLPLKNDSYETQKHLKQSLIHSTNNRPYVKMSITT